MPGGLVVSAVCGVAAAAFGLPWSLPLIVVALLLLVVAFEGGAR